MTQTVNIYCLKAPDTGIVYYVGQTRHSIDDRAKQHIASCRAYHTRKDVWIRSLIDAQKVPAVELLEVCPIRDRDERERYWLSVFMEKNPAITNGRSPTRPYGQRRESSLLIQIRTTEDERNLAAAMADKYQTDTATLLKALLQYAEKHSPVLTFTKTYRSRGVSRNGA